jgi:hypothetical protein
MKEARPFFSHFSYSLVFLSYLILSWTIKAVKPLFCELLFLLSLYLDLLMRTFTSMDDPPTLTVDSSSRLLFNLMFLFFFQSPFLYYL